MNKRLYFNVFIELIRQKCWCCCCWWWRWWQT